MFSLTSNNSQKENLEDKVARIEHQLEKERLLYHSQLTDEKKQRAVEGECYRHNTKLITQLLSNSQNQIVSSSQAHPSNKLAPEFYQANSMKNYLIHEAVKEKLMPVIEMLVNADPKFFLNVKAANGQTPLIIAVNETNVDFKPIDFLIQFDVLQSQLTDHSHRAAIHYAVRRNDHDNYVPKLLSLLPRLEPVAQIAPEEAKSNDLAPVTISQPQQFFELLVNDVLLYQHENNIKHVFNYLNQHVPDNYWLNPLKNTIINGEKANAFTKRIHQFLTALHQEVYGSTRITKGLLIYNIPTYLLLITILVLFILHKENFTIQGYDYIAYSLLASSIITFFMTLCCHHPQGCAFDPTIDSLSFSSKLYYEMMEIVYYANTHFDLHYKLEDSNFSTVQDVLTIMADDVKQIKSEANAAKMILSAIIPEKVNTIIAEYNDKQHLQIISSPELPAPSSWVGSPLTEPLLHSSSSDSNIIDIENESEEHKTTLKI